jgi:hypothetical protein
LVAWNRSGVGELRKILSTVSGQPEIAISVLVCILALIIVINEIYTKKCTRPLKSWEGLGTVCDIT